ncbi:ANL family adenylate-forming protein [Aliikangiella sp. IMCC44359]|uniref:ANL family adenylate-forming protein n=1 Tax=Aliikangiella sp. IMCC44359 TaxID=3459125 RepID=UPI00403AA966
MGLILERISEFKEKNFITHQGKHYSYKQVAMDVHTWLEKFSNLGLKSGDVVSIVGQFSLNVTSLFLALIENNNIVVPIDDEAQEDIEKRHKIAGVKYSFKASQNELLECFSVGQESQHVLLEELRNNNKAGIILFTSGSTGEGKAAVHRFDKLIARYLNTKKRKPINAMVFLKFDHIGGVSTMFSILMNGGCMTSVEERTPESICQLIENEKVEILPTTPSFLNMLIMSKAWENYNLSSLKVITYGTEPMPESTLNTMAKLFPNIKLKQTYGLTELGIFPTKSKSNASTFMSIKEGKEGDVRIKIKDDMLFIKSDMAMLGYLNAPSPFDKDGWYNTGDKVIVDGDYAKILGRDSEIINIGGEKVYPSEIEGVLLEMPNIKNVVVDGKSSPITGQIVRAIFELHENEDVNSLTRRVREFCQDKIEGFKIPRDIEISDQGLVSSRFKKIRKNITKHHSKKLLEA